jgi:hypothetical protein
MPFRVPPLNRELTEMCYRSKNTFTFPESSDVEDEEAFDDFSEDDIGEREQTSSEDGVSIESPLAKVSAAAAPIDLTGDEEPPVFPSNSIDLTGENVLEEGLMDMMEGRPADIPEDADPINIGVYAGTNPILVDSDDEDAHFSIDSDDQSEMAEDDASSENDSHDEAGESDGSEEEASDDADDSDMENHEPSAMEAPAPSLITSNIRFALATHANSTVRLSDIRTRMLEPQDLADDDDESEFGLEEAGAVGIRALKDDGLLCHGYINPYPAPSEASNHAARDFTFPAQISQHVSIESTTSMQSRPDNTSVPGRVAGDHSRFQAAQSTIRHELKLAEPVARQPSPSDAAMVKGRLHQRESGHIGVCDLGEFGRPAAQTLGEKTGKGDFFEAREINKAKFIAGNRSGPTIATGPGFICGPNVDQNRHRSINATANPFEQQQHPFGASQSSKPPTGPTVSFGESYHPFKSFQASSAINKLSPADLVCKFITRSFQDSLLTGLDFPTREQCSFLDNPAHGPPLERAPSPEPYLTSAVNYNAATQRPRSGLGINDIINTSSTMAQSLKRKADEISDATDAELRVWAQSSTSSTDDPMGSGDVADAKAPAAVSSPGTETVPAAPGAPAARPTKRLKKLLENVGYAALGGVAVGAGLFSVLVATAPDFL